ncbi:hypothetical protein N9102_00020 [bacterium]|nr:hypothetical protein [bacterium]
MKSPLPGKMHDRSRLQCKKQSWQTGTKAMTVFLECYGGGDNGFSEFWNFQSAFLGDFYRYR